MEAETLTRMTSAVLNGVAIVDENGKPLHSLRAARFTKDGPSYAQMAQYAADQRDMFDNDEEGIACFCGD